MPRTREALTCEVKIVTTLEGDGLATGSYADRLRLAEESYAIGHSDTAPPNHLVKFGGRLGLDIHFASQRSRLRLLEVGQRNCLLLRGGGWLWLTCGLAPLNVRDGTPRYRTRLFFAVLDDHHVATGFNAHHGSANEAAILEVDHIGTNTVCAGALRYEGAGGQR